MKITKPIRIIFFALLLSSAFLFLIPSGVSASDPSLPRTSVSCDSDAGAPFTCAAAIDNNAGTRWVSLNSPPYPHHITLTIGGPTKVVSSVALNQACLEYSATGSVFAGAVQIGSWSGGTSANLTIAVTPTLTSTIEFRGLTDHGGGTGYECAVEVWAFGHDQPPCAFGDIGITTDSIIPILVSGGLIMLILGYFAFSSDGAKSHSFKGVSIELVLVAVIGLIIVIAVSAGVIASMKLCP